MKKYFIPMLIIFTLFINWTCCFSISNEEYNIGDNPPPMSPGSDVEDIVVNIFGVFQWIGYVVAVFMLVWAGIRYVTSSAGEKANVKETLVPMVVGAILVAGATIFATVIFNI